MGWPEFEKLLEEKRPKYYLTQVTAPTLKNDMIGVFHAKALGVRITTVARRTACFFVSHGSAPEIRKGRGKLLPESLPENCHEITRKMSALLTHPGDQ